MTGRLRAHPLVRAVVLVRPDPWRSLLAVLAGTGALSCAVGLMATSAWLIARAAEHPPVMYLQVAVVATRAFGIGRGVLRYAERLVSHDAALRGVGALRVRLYSGLAAGDPARVASLRRGDLLARVGADVDTLADLLVRSVLPFATGLLTSVLACLLVGALLPAAGVVLAVALAVAGIAVPAWTARVAAAQERELTLVRAEQSAQVLALLDGAAELTVGGAAPDRLARVAALDRRVAAAADRAALPAALATGCGVLATGAAVVGALLLGVRAATAGSLDGVLLAVVALTPLAAAEAVAGLPAAATGLVRARAGAERVLALLDLADAAPPAPAPPAPPAPDPRTAAGPVGATRGLRAGDLACGWPCGPVVLSGVDLDLSPGRRVAVVGASGGGKTTLLLTLAGLLPPRTGHVRLDGTDLASLPPSTVRHLVTFVAEDAHVFTTTVAENVRVARPDAGDEEVAAALAGAGLSGWLAGLPAGLATMLGTGGVGISGGERRRLLMARAALTGARVRLFDEPAEHLDPVTADALVTGLLTADGEPDTAVLVVTHRLGPLAAADEVLVVDDGRVVARGTHAELVASHRPYRLALQAESGVAVAAA